MQRDWLCSPPSGFAAVGFAAPGAQAAEVNGPKLKWDVSLWGKKRAFTAGVERLSALVKEKTGGNWTIMLHYGGALSKSRENLDGLSVNAFQAAMFCNFYHPKKNPALMSLTMPFLPMSDWANNRKIRDAVYAHPAVKKELAQWNAMTYTSSYLPQYEFLGRGKPPATLADWKGLTVRAGGGVARAMKVLGATPTSSTATEVYTGVQQGTMDAASFPFTYAHVAYKIPEVADWYTANLSPGTSDCPLAFRSRPIAPSRAVQEAARRREGGRDRDPDPGLYRDGQEELPMLKKKLTEVRYSDDQLAKFRAAAGKPVIEKWIKENQGKFDARGVIQTIFKAVGQTY